MNPEIEELRKFSQTTVTKGRLEKLREAAAKATALLENLEPKPDDEDAEADFESSETELEGNLGDLEAGCDSLEAAEDKDERESAQDDIASALEDTVRNFDDILPVSVKADPAADPRRRAELKAKFLEIAQGPEDQIAQSLEAWFQSAPTPREQKKRRECFAGLLEASRKAEASKPMP